MNIRVLVIEDDAGTADAILQALHRDGHRPTHAADGLSGLARARSGEFDVIVLDRMLPGLDGLSVLGELKAAGVEAPVLILSALAGLDERVRGLRAGGDDYLAKPFESLELLARVEALFRRKAVPAESERETRLDVGELHVDLITRTAHRGPRRLELMPREYELLVHLMRRTGQIATRAMLFEAVWNYRCDEPTNVIDVYIGRLRRKVDADGEPPMIRTVRGAGYVLQAAD